MQYLLNLFAVWNWFTKNIQTSTNVNQENYMRDKKRDGNDKDVCMYVKS